MTNISFVLRSKEDATLIDAIESSRYRELASSKARVIEISHRKVMKLSRNDETFTKWWKNFEVMITYFVMNKALQGAHLEHFESLAFWVLNILSHLSFFFSFLLLSLVYSLSMIRYLLDLFIELIVTMTN